MMLPDSYLEHLKRVAPDKLRPILIQLYQLILDANDSSEKSDNKPVESIDFSTYEKRCQAVDLAHADEVDEL